MPVTQNIGHFAKEHDFVQKFIHFGEGMFPSASWFLAFSKTKNFESRFEVDRYILLLLPVRDISFLGGGR